MDKSMTMRRELALIVVWLLLTVGIVANVSVQAQQQEASPPGTPAVYEAILVNQGNDSLVLPQLEARLPAGSSYVGLAVGSTVRREAVQATGQLVWKGPFTLSPGTPLILRFWLAPGPSAVAPAEIEITAPTHDGGTFGATAHPIHLSAPPHREIASAGAAGDLSVIKVAEKPILPPDGDPWLSYVVTFTNNAPLSTTLERISDTMASGFEFVGMAVGSDIADQPLDPSHNPVVWQGPWSVPGGGSLRLRYWVKAAGEAGVYQNTVQASSNGNLIGPAEATVTVLGPHLSLTKSATPVALTTGQVVTYDVTLSNQGNYSGSIALITDTLPENFVFYSMAQGSEITDPPTGTGGVLVWTGPYTVPPGGETHLIYQVHSGGTGPKTNLVIARDGQGEVIGTASSQVTVDPAHVMLPLVCHNFSQSPPPSLDETFENGVPAAWTPFVNYAGLDPNFWFWSGGTGWGRYDFSPQVAGSRYRGWGLSMYLADETEKWRDYRVEAMLRTSRGAKHTLAGIWFRGTHELQTDLQGGQVTGYYIVIKPTTDQVLLGKIPKNQPQFQVVDWVQSAGYPAGIEDFYWYDLTVQVEGAHIVAWLDGTKLIDWTDPDPWETGTVGLVAYAHEGAQFDSIHVSGPQ